MFEGLISVPTLRICRPAFFLSQSLLGKVSRLHNAEPAYLQGKKGETSEITQYFKLLTV